MVHWFLDFLYSQWFVTPQYPQQDFSDKVVIVTGANSGLGRQAAEHIVRLGAAKVILAGRNPSALEVARQEIVTSTNCNTAVVEAWELDLCNYQSVKAFARKAEARLPRLDVVIESAGIHTTNFKLAEQDELSITVNVVSTFLLGLLLLPQLKATANTYNTRPHLVIVSSAVHFYTTMARERKALAEHQYDNLFDALSDPKTADMSERYYVSKLLEVFTVREMVRTTSMDYPVVINYVNPGFCRSGLAREMEVSASIASVILGARTTEVGSRTLVHAASAGRESHGQYLDDCMIKSPAKFVTSSEGEVFQRRVWKDLGERLSNIVPGILQNL